MPDRNRNILQNELSIQGDEQDTEFATRLKNLYFNQISSAVPQRDIIYYCACGLAQSDETMLACDIFEELIEQGYNIQECRFKLAQTLYQDGNIIKSEKVIQKILQDEPNNHDAKKFYDSFRQTSKRDGKLLLYSVIGITTIIGLFFTLRNEHVQFKLRNLTLPFTNTTKSKQSFKT